MAINSASSYGVDIACVLDADEFHTEVTGVDLVRQDAIHRFMVDDVLGEGGTGWGFNAVRMLGMDPSQIAAMQPFLASVLQRDERINSADVTLTVTAAAAGGIEDIAIFAQCETDEGPFEFTLPVSQITAALIDGQGP